MQAKCDQRVCVFKENILFTKPDRVYNVHTLMCGGYIINISIF